MMRVIKRRRRVARRRRRRRLKVLSAFARGDLTKNQAVQKLKLRDYAGLLVALGHYGVPLPTLPADEVERMVTTFLSVWRRPDDGAYPP